MKRLKRLIRRIESAIDTFEWWRKTGGPIHRLWMRLRGYNLLTKRNFENRPGRERYAITAWLADHPELDWKLEVDGWVWIRMGELMLEGYYDFNKPVGSLKHREEYNVFVKPPLQDGEKKSPLEAKDPKWENAIDKRGSAAKKIEEADKTRSKEQTDDA